MAFEARGYHVVADVIDVGKKEFLTSIELFLPHLREAAKRAGGTIVGFESYSFEDGSYSAVLILAESHLSVHTNPSKASVAFDVFMCGHKARPKAALLYLTEVLAGKATKVAELVRDPQWGMGGNLETEVFENGKDSHLIVELVNVPEDQAREISKSVPILMSAMAEQDVRITASHFKSFGAQYGYSGALLLDKGHLTVHTWPECGFISLDVYIQDNKIDKGQVVEFLCTKLKCTHTDKVQLNRG